MKRNMSAPLWVCLGLLLMVSRPSRARPTWSAGILDNKDVELSLQKPVEVPNQLLEAQSAVKTFIQGANEEALEHLAAMKQQHMQLARQQFFNALEKRLFRLDVLKPQPTWPLRPCRGSVLNCFLLPKKSYLNRPVYSKTYPVTYVNHQNFCNHLPFNTYLFHECKRRSQLLYTKVTIKPKTETYSPTSAHVTEKSSVSQFHVTNKEQIQQVTLPNHIYNLDTTTPIKIEIQKLNSQKITTQLEKEILGIKDIENDHTFMNIYSTSLQTEKNTFTTRKATDSVAQNEFANARNELETSTLPVDKYELNTNTVTAHVLTNPPSDIEINVEGRVDQVVTDSPTSSSFSTDAKELIQSSTNLDDLIYKTSTYNVPRKITLSPSPTFDLNKTYSTSNGKIQGETEIPTESTGNVKELYNEAREEVNMSYPPDSASQYAFSNPTTDPKDTEANDITEAIQTEISLLAREEVQAFKPLPDELNSHTGSTDSMPIQTTQGSTITSSTLLNKWLNEVISSQATPSTDSNKPNQNQNSMPEKLVTEKTLYITEEESSVQLSSEPSKVEYHQQAIEEIVPITLESTSPSTSEIADVTFKTDESESFKYPIEDRENAQHLLEDTNFQSTGFTLKGYENEENDLDIARTTPLYNQEEDKITASNIVHKEPYLDVKDKLLDQTLYSSQSENLNYDENHIYTASVDSKERITEPSSYFDESVKDTATNEEQTLFTSPRLAFEETTINSILNAGDMESRTFDDMIATTEYFELGNNDFTERLRDSNLTTDNSSTSVYQNVSDDILKFTSEIESTSLDRVVSEEELSSTLVDGVLSEDFFTLGTKDEISLRGKRSLEDKLPDKLEDSSLNYENSSDVYISPNRYASTILELLPVIREGYRNNAFSDEDKKVIRSIFGEMRTLMDEDSLKKIDESDTDLLMGDETSKIEDIGDYYDYESSESEEASAKNERRLKRSKIIQTLTTSVSNLSTHPQRQFRDQASSSSPRRSRHIRSSGPHPVPEAAAILALLAENGQGVQLDRADDEDDDEYEYYEDDDIDEDEDEDLSYEDSYDDNPSFTELIKLARKHRHRKAME